MEKEVIIEAVASYGGSNVKQSGVVDLTCVFAYDELVEVLTFAQMLNNDIDMRAKLPDAKAPMKVGTFRLGNISIAGDGTSKVKFVSSVDFAEMDNLNKLVPGDNDKFRVRLSSKVEVEEGSEKDDDEEW